MDLVNAIDLSWSPLPPVHAAAKAGHARCLEYLLARKDEVYIAKGLLDNGGGAGGIDIETHKIRAGPELDSDVVGTIPAGKTVVVVSEADVPRPDPTTSTSAPASAQTKKTRGGGGGWGKRKKGDEAQLTAVDSDVGSKEAELVRRFKVSFPRMGWVTALNFEPVQASTATPRTFVACGLEEVAHKVRSSPDLDSTTVGTVSGGVSVVVVREVTVIKPITGVAAAAVNVLGKQKDGKSNWKKLRAAHAEGKLKNSSAAAVAGKW